jgi:hypothetical protein
LCDEVRVRFGAANASARAQAFGPLPLADRAHDFTCAENEKEAAARKRDCFALQNPLPWYLEHEFSPSHFSAGAPDCGRHRLVAIHAPVRAPDFDGSGERRARPALAHRDS